MLLILEFVKMKFSEFDWIVWNPLFLLCVLIKLKTYMDI